MKLIKTEIEGVVIIESKIFHDSRGYFFESFSQEKFITQVFPTKFVQDNESKSVFGVLRGLHYQLPPYSQSKLVRVVYGQILDVAVDIRIGSPTFGHHVIEKLSDENKKMLFIPRGFAHGFVVLSDLAIFQYKCDNYYAPKAERSIKWNDPVININWQIDPSIIIISEKDMQAPLLCNAELFKENASLYD